MRPHDHSTAGALELDQAPPRGLVKTWFVFTRLSPLKLLIEQLRDKARAFVPLTPPPPRGDVGAAGRGTPL